MNARVEGTQLAHLLTLAAGAWALFCSACTFPITNMLSRLVFITRAIITLEMTCAL